MTHTGPAADRPDIGRLGIDRRAAALPPDRACRARALLLAVSLCAGASATAAPLIFMSPGLYRIDTEGNMTHANGRATTTQQVDGATGDVTMQRKMDDDAYSHSAKGKRPVTVCVKPVAGHPMPLLPSEQAARCSEQSTTPTPDGYIHVARCPGAYSKITARRLDSDTWIMDREFESKPMPGGPDLNAMRPALELAARQGTPEQRERAVKALAALPGMQENMAAQRVKMLASLEKSRAKAKSPEEAASLDQQIRAVREWKVGDTIRGVQREKWTRIGYTCTAGKE
jgi:hypothetical protein